MIGQGASANDPTKTMAPMQTQSNPGRNVLTSPTDQERRDAITEWWQRKADYEIVRAIKDRQSRPVKRADKSE